MTFASDMRHTVSIIASLAVALQPTFVYALPVGGSVGAGSASISSSGTQTTVTQNSAKAVLNWTGFDTSAGETVRFVQPSAQAIALNRISGGPTSFDGSLLANGQVWLLNSNGILFGKNAQVNVGGLLATTSSISNSNFMAGNYTFTPGGNPNATITNNGAITVAQGGLAALVAPSVVNSGTITANLGKVQLISSDNYAVDLYGDGLINLYASPAITSQLVANHGTITASGGSVTLSTAAASNVVSSLINMDGVIEADNGAIAVNAATLENTGTMQSTGGSIAINAKNIGQQGTLAANGGAVNETFSGAYIDNAASLTEAQGGNISLIGSGAGSSLFASGNYNVSGATGGTIAMTANQMWLYAADLNASGTHGGGSILLGGDLHGAGTLAHAGELSVNSYTTLTASAAVQGNGGEIVAWSDTQTAFAATATAKGGSGGGNGGTIEISSAGKDYVGGKATASAAHGASGSVLIDPHDITISDDSASGGLAFFQLTNPDPSSASGFGSTIQPLSTGNVVVTNPQDSFAASNAGAAYLFNGRTGALISTLTGSNTDDYVGGNNGLDRGGGVTALTNGNYVIASPSWNISMGAVTWGNGTSGVSGMVSSDNSLVGSTGGCGIRIACMIGAPPGDTIGNNGVVALTNGNYVVVSPDWSADMGAVTWGNGATGITGTISSDNSLVGSTASTSPPRWCGFCHGTPGDGIGGGGVVALANGNYVVSSPYWSGKTGAATWGSGKGGVTGLVSSANSLVGSAGSDWVSLGNASVLFDAISFTRGGITALTNGNYVVNSPQWNGQTGAVTWGSGTAGVSGTISSANSLVGSTPGDQVGSNGVTTLTNGNYVVASPNWNSSTGGVTWGNGTSGITGGVSSGNSLVGSAPGDGVGYGVTALSNGNYVVFSPGWNNNTGAATWGNGTIGISGVIDSSISLVGSVSGDQVGGNVYALTNGNYVVISPNWNGNIGAVTWGNGSIGITGTVSSGNSLMGSVSGDLVGVGGVTPLANGNYVVASPDWNSNEGAATWGAGTSEIGGVVSSSNSLVGSNPGDQVGYYGVTALTNGNYVVSSPNWNSNAGAATWGSGLGGISGVVSSGNSLVGSTSGDQVGSNGITILSNGNYVVSSPNWNGGVGAFTWGNGTTGVTGTISTANSILDSAGSGINNIVEDVVNHTYYAAFNNGDVFVSPSAGPAALSTFSFLPGADFTVDAGYLAATLGSGTSVVLQANNDITVANIITVTSPNSSTLTLDAGRSILIDAGITTDGGNLTVAANEPASAGVVNANRDAGTAVIDTTGGTIDTGTGSVSITLNAGAGLTNNTAGNITLGTISAGGVTAVNHNATGDVVLDGILTASGSGTAVTLSSARDFINNDVSADALDLTGGGRWLIYSTNPSDDTPGGLTSNFTTYSCTFGGSCPSFSGSGNGFLYSYVLPVPPSSAMAEPSTVTLATVNTGMLTNTGGSNATGSGDFLITYDDAFYRDNFYHASVCIGLTADGECVTAH